MPQCAKMLQLLFFLEVSALHAKRFL